MSDTFPGYDAWKTTDPAIENECEECGVDVRFEEHDEDCSVGSYEPDYESIIRDREEARDW